MAKYTTEQFIMKAKEIHGDKYDYSKTNYIDSKTKICIICPEHGEFWQRPTSHLQGYGCRKCGHRKALSSIKKSPKEEFIRKAKLIFGDLYDYSNVVYIDSKNPVDITCSKHGIFKVSPASFLRSTGCPKCFHEKLGLQKRINKNDFFIKAKKLHPSLDFSKSVFEKSNDKILVICPKHGEFISSPSRILRGEGCRKCSNENKLLSTEDFISRAKQIHGNYYSYEHSIYSGLKRNIIITCPIHGDFEQPAYSHLRGYGCKYCSSSSGENIIEYWLDRNNIKYSSQYYINYNNKNMYVDFFVEYKNRNYIIEYNGIQHYKMISRFYKTENEFKNQIVRDYLLKQYCSINNIILLEIPYIMKRNDIELMLSIILN